MPYEVQTPIFEGPFDLLLHLILEQEVDLYQLNLFTIVDRYLAEVHKMVGLDLDVATEFLLIASTLVELKTRWLLPKADKTVEEDWAIWEERDLLLARLVENRTFKGAAGLFVDMMQLASRSWPRTAGMEEQFVELAPTIASIKPEALSNALLRALTPRSTPRLDLSHLAPIRVTVREAVDDILARLRRAASGKATFAELTGHFTERIQVVVRFLALLELYKAGAIDLEQAENFGMIEVVLIDSDAYPTFDRVTGRGLGPEVMTQETVETYDG